MQMRKGKGDEKPLLVYGASSAVGAAVIRLAGIMGVYPLICVAGRGRAFMESLIDGSKEDDIRLWTRIGEGT